jgi:dihydrofolate reductase
MAKAKAAAGDRNVLVHGAYTAQRALEAGVLDELQIHLIPALFGSGLHQFNVLPSRVELEIVRLINTQMLRTSATASVAEGPLCGTLRGRAEWPILARKLLDGSLVPA